MLKNSYNIPSLLKKNPENLYFPYVQVWLKCTETIGSNIDGVIVQWSETKAKYEKQWISRIIWINTFQVNEWSRRIF